MSSETSNLLSNVPSLSELAGEWKDFDWLAHLPSVRSQLGQALVNRDVTSLSWFASPPFACGYHTGVLSLNGEVPLSTSFRWYPYQALRRADMRGLAIESATRMLFDEHGVAWRVAIENSTTAVRSFELELDCMAMVVEQKDQWGWLYSQPWKNGMRHDFVTAERQRALIGSRESHQFMLSPFARELVIGSCAPVRDSGVGDGHGDVPMLCESELPQHTTPAGKPKPKPGFVGKVRSLQLRDAAAVAPQSLQGSVLIDHPYELDLVGPASRFVIEAVVLPDKLTLQLAVMPSLPASDGHVLSHGNQPESLQLYLTQGRLHLDLGGDCIALSEPLPVNAWSLITVTFDGLVARLFVGDDQRGETTPWWVAEQWRSTVVSSRCLEVRHDRSNTVACYAFARDPDVLVQHGSGGKARWRVVLQPGERTTINYALHIGHSSTNVRQRAEAFASDFQREFDAIAERWETRWRGMFTPAAGFFSGHLPILETDDNELKRVYYMTPLNLLYMLRTGLPVNDKVFLTGGPRLGPTITFLWDTQGFSTLYALLEPVGLKAWIRSALAHDIATFFALDNYGDFTIGNRYVANNQSLSRLIHDYVAVSGDKAFLEEQVGSQSVLGHLETMTNAWMNMTDARTGGSCADFGPDHWDLLECVPNYKHVVASFNAAFVLMSRRLAAIYQSLGDHGKADALRLSARGLADAILGLYAGNGHWFTRHPNGDQVVHHCLDFQMVAAALHEDLPAVVKDEMVTFVREELLTDSWMRAQSLLDPVVEYSDRADHGAFGAYDGWPGETAQGLCHLGRHDVAMSFLRSIHAVTLEGTWSQAHEFFRDVKTGHAQARIAERGANCRDATAGATIGEAFVRGIFQYQPTVGGGDDVLPLAARTISAHFTGILHNVRHRGGRFTIRCRQGNLSS
jgi:hypothetical protein